MLTVSGAGGERLHAVSAAAERAGLRAGMNVADARALQPRLDARPAELPADRAALERLARWCGRFSPWTAADPGAPGLDGILLDITGCARVFAGEGVLLKRLHEETRALGFCAFAAAAPTIGLAWGLSRFAAPNAPAGRIAVNSARGVVEALPAAALRLEPPILAALARFGLKTIGDLLPVPRADLARRFGGDLVRRLDQALGAEAEALDPLQPEAVLRARTRFAEARTTLEGVKAGLCDAIAALCRRLEAEALGATRLRLTLYRVDGASRSFPLGVARASRDRAHLSRLALERLDRLTIDIGFGVDLIEAAAALAEPLSCDQGDFSGAQARRGAQFSALADRLRARLGDDAVASAEATDSHIPERAGRWSGFTSSPDAWPKRVQARPLLILARAEPAEAVAEIPDGPPRQFTWRKVRHRVARAEGPERIAPEWWRDNLWAGREPVLTRDYFHVETEAGRRFWLYRDGLYARETDAPRWFVHGAG